MGGRTAPEEQRSGPPEIALPSGVPWRVLLVDDRSERRSLLRMVVGTVPPEGWTSVEITEASDSAGAAKRHDVDAAVVEIQMAGGVGLEVIEALRAAHPSLVVVVCSFRADSEMRARAFLAGADAYLSKPVSRRELLAACRTRRPPVLHPPAGSPS